ncbi:MAG: hydrogenase maturation protease [Dinoroseobacter sp.]|nr:hydrogenase maturation protease [Dinoroseobacter sp.]
MVLLIGYGNPGRGDDGLGPALAQRIEKRSLSDLEVKIAFQLTVEHALDVAKADIVVFADACMASQEPFTFTEISSTSPGDLDSHNVSPQSVLALAEELFGSSARGFALAISGCEFGEVKEGMSDPAIAHLGAAEAFLLGWFSRLSPMPKV